jgi:hypothetical protein
MITADGLSTGDSSEDQGKFNARMKRHAMTY